MQPLWQTVEKIGQKHSLIFKHCPLTWLIAHKAIIMVTNNVLQALTWLLAQSEASQPKSLARPAVCQALMYWGTLFPVFIWKAFQRFAYGLPSVRSHVSFIGNIVEYLKSCMGVNRDKLNLQRTEGIEAFEVFITVDVMCKLLLGWVILVLLNYYVLPSLPTYIFAN